MRIKATVFVIAAFAPHDVLSDSVGRVATVNAPLAYIAESLGAPKIEVIFPAPPGVDPAYWRPSDEAVQSYQQADLILLNGAGYAAWVDDAVLARSRLVNTTRQVEDRLLPADGGVVHKHGPEGEHVHNETYKITTWLDPVIARAQVDAAAAGMSRRWPDLADRFYARAKTLQEEIWEMDRALSAFAEGLEGRQVFASHPVYGYFERAYSVPVTSLHWEPELVPDEPEWSRFSKEIDAGRAPVMIWAAAPLEDTAGRLAVLGVDIVVLNPMANPEVRDDLFRQLGAQVHDEPQ